MTKTAKMRQRRLRPIAVLCNGQRCGKMLKRIRPLQHWCSNACRESDPTARTRRNKEE